MITAQTKIRPVSTLPRAGANGSTGPDVLATSLGHGTAILVVLHELGALHPLIDRAVVLREGRVAYDGALMTLQSGGHHGHHEHESPLPRPAWFEGTLEGSGER